MEPLHYILSHHRVYNAYMCPVHRRPINGLVVVRKAATDGHAQKQLEAAPAQPASCSSSPRDVSADAKEAIHDSKQKYPSEDARQPMTPVPPISGDGGNRKVFGASASLLRQIKCRAPQTARDTAPSVPNNDPNKPKSRWSRKNLTRLAVQRCAPIPSADLQPQKPSTAAQSARRPVNKLVHELYDLGVQHQKDLHNKLFAKYSPKKEEAKMDKYAVASQADLMSTQRSKLLQEKHEAKLKKVMEEDMAAPPAGASSSRGRSPARLNKEELTKSVFRLYNKGVDVSYATINKLWRQEEMRCAELRSQNRPASGSRHAEPKVPKRTDK